jgi:hypothetical protein
MQSRPLQLEIELIKGSAGLPKEAVSTGFRGGDKRGFFNQTLNCKKFAKM